MAVCNPNCFEARRNREPMLYAMPSDVGRPSNSGVRRRTVLNQGPKSSPPSPPPPPSPPSTPHPSLHPKSGVACLRLQAKEIAVMEQRLLKDGVAESLGQMAQVGENESNRFGLPCFVWSVGLCGCLSDAFFELIQLRARVGREFPTWGAFHDMLTTGGQQSTSAPSKPPRSLQTPNNPICVLAYLFFCLVEQSLLAYLFWFYVIACLLACLFACHVDPHTWWVASLFLLV